MTTPDKWLFAATIGLALFGVVMVYSASAVIAQRENGNQYYYVIKQGIWTSIGFVVMLAAMQFDYNRLRDRRIVYGLLLLTVLLLLAVFAFGRVNGAHRWIKFKGFSIQPSELSKLVLAHFCTVRFHYWIAGSAGGCRAGSGNSDDVGSHLWRSNLHVGRALVAFGNGRGPGISWCGGFINFRPGSHAAHDHVSRSLGRPAG